MDGWTNALLIPFGKLSFSKKTLPLFSGPKQTCKMKSEWPRSGSLLPVAYKHKHTAIPIAFLLIWPLQFAAHFTGMSHKIYHISTMTAAYNTHIHICNWDKYLHRLNVTQESCTKQSRWWLIQILYGKLVFLSCALHTTQASSWTKQLVSFSQHLLNKADHHISHYHHIPYYYSSSGVTNLTVSSLLWSVQRIAK